MKYFMILGLCFGLLQCETKKIIIENCNDISAIHTFVDKKDLYITEYQSNSTISSINILSVKKNGANFNLGNPMEIIHSNVTTFSGFENSINITTNDVLEYEIDAQYIKVLQRNDQNNELGVFLISDTRNFYLNTQQFLPLKRISTLNDNSLKLNVKQIEAYFNYEENYTNNSGNKTVKLNKNTSSILTFYIGIVSIKNNQQTPTDQPLSEYAILNEPSSIKSAFVKINLSPSMYKNNLCVDQKKEYSSLIIDSFTNYPKH